MADYSAFDDTAFDYSDDDDDTNGTANPTIRQMVEARLSRRALMNVTLSVAATASALALVGCGDNGQAPFPAATLQVSAAKNQTSAGRVAALAGTADVGTPTSVTWTQISGPTAIINNATSLNASFVAPAVTAATPLQFQLSATNASGSRVTAVSTVLVMPGALGFGALPKSLADVVSVPAGYSVTVLYRLGDPITAATPAYANNGTDTDFASRAGDHHDGLYFFGLAATGTAPDPTSNTRGVCPVAEAIKEIECHGVSVIEIARTELLEHGATTRPRRSTAASRRSRRRRSTDRCGVPRSCAPPIRPTARPVAARSTIARTASRRGAPI